MEQMSLPVQLVQQIVNYLQTKPWGEVNPFISEIVKHAPKQEEPKKEEPANP